MLLGLTRSPALAPFGPFGPVLLGISRSPALAPFGPFGPVDLGFTRSPALAPFGPKGRGRCGFMGTGGTPSPPGADTFAASDEVDCGSSSGERGMGQRAGFVWRRRGTLRGGR